MLSVCRPIALKSLDQWLRAPATKFKDSSTTPSPWGCFLVFAARLIYFKYLHLRMDCAVQFIRTHKYISMDSKIVRQRNSDAIPRVELAEEAVRIAEKEIRI